MIKTPLSTVIGGAFWTPGCTIIGGASKTLNQIIKSLFSNNEQGFFYDPNDLSTMFQDAAGTVPVTGVGQPVGLMLDKSRGLSLGSEQFPNFDFNNWVSAGAVSSKTQNSVTTTGVGGVYKTIQSGARKTYSVKIAGVCNQSFTIRSAGSSIGEVIVDAGSFNLEIKSTVMFVEAAEIYFLLLGAGTLTLTSLSVCELGGNHAYQTASASRPLLQDAPRRIDFDAVDDKLITNLPAQLTGCTVVRSVPNVGTQILTNQTIPTTYNDNTDHCGLIVINRALTATETSQITKLFNKAAGV